MYPLKMKPLYKEILWGGNTLKTLYGRELPFEKTAESWEAAAHKNGCSVVDNGVLAGKTIPELINEYGENFLGSVNKNENIFPLLFKLIDARDFLSVQVHPDDELAKKDGDKGKTEMWIVLSAEKGAGLYMGFNRKISKAEYEEHINNNTLKDVLNFAEVKKGDVFFIKAGTVHAIGAGLVIAEIQQNSDTTYRVYDWGRVSNDGKARELHIEKALEASSTDKFSGENNELTFITDSNKLTYYPVCKYFGAVKAEIDGEFSDSTENRSFHILFCSDGEGEISFNGVSEKIKAGETFVIPADTLNYKISGKIDIFKFFVPDFELDYKKPLKANNFSNSSIDAIIIK